ncbi:MAG TPA: hypothetical protein VFQ60_02195 [Patescibacteria group bacterium]|nr:hypothetical protein [Patescibacteria group bacterium]
MDAQRARSNLFPARPGSNVSHATLTLDEAVVSFWKSRLDASFRKMRSADFEPLVIHRSHLAQSDPLWRALTVHLLMNCNRTKDGLVLRTDLGVFQSPLTFQVDLSENDVRVTYIGEPFTLSSLQVL